MEKAPMICFRFTSPKPWLLLWGFLLFPRTRSFNHLNFCPKSSHSKRNHGCIYYENLRIKSTVFPNFRSYLCHALRGQFLKRKSKKYVFSVWITCPSCISYETAMLNVFCRKNGNKLMHYANNTNEIPFLTYSDALCGGFRKLRLQENYIWKQPESCDASMIAV